MKKRILTGLQPSGELTIGSFVGAIKQMADLQDEYDSFLFVPDLHTLTVPQDAKELHERIKKHVGLYLACGVDPNKHTFYIQSENLYHANLSWILECNTYIGEANRMTQFKDKSKKVKNVSVGLLTYPILMAADILLYDADYVPVGLDQKQHVELARDIAIRFNHLYGDTFTVPEPLIPKVGAKIMALQDPTKKMSKSDTNPKNSIFLLDKEEDIRKKISQAVTDSENIIKYDPQNKPGISNLITIYSCFSNLSISEIEEKFKNSNYGTFKMEVANTLVESLTNIQKKYETIMSSGIVDEILDKGLAKTNILAKEKYETVIKKVGLYR